ncbi:MAG: biopolymer transporter ExbD [Pseudomonadota bacterium]
MQIDLAIKPRRRLSLTSLIDVIFLLLLFFMLSSTFTRFADVELVAGRSGQTIVSELPKILIVLDGDSWGVNGVRLPRDDAIELLVSKTEEAHSTAVVLVRGKTDAQQLVSAVETLHKLEGLRFSVAR